MDSFLRCRRDWEFDLLLLLCINSPCLQIGTLIKTLNLALESLGEWMSGRKVSSTTRLYMALIIIIIIIIIIEKRKKKRIICIFYNNKPPKKTKLYFWLLNFYFFSFWSLKFEIFHFSLPSLISFGPYIYFRDSYGH